ncbi:hypothetical protein [Capnocytophaga sp.]|uniref:hypothetical protein n=1 Tax=Capnocytophaga sp. TaxID=44737 RepID=UPI0026DD22C1|nr:hypothetical protein [Capnocytophaga sp.]MDO5106016.1 hypothetical protein [Capnocytophaga sp.]
MAKTKNQPKTVKTTKLGVTKGKKVVNRKNITQNKVMLPRSIKAVFTKHIKACMKSKKPRLKLWYCGITNDTNRRIAEHKIDKGPIKHLKFIETLTKEYANEVETYFHKKGTINRSNIGGSTLNSRFVYIFKVSNEYVKNRGLAAPDVNLIDTILENLFSNN